MPNADGQPVEEWPDKLGNASRRLLQATPSMRPGRAVTAPWSPVPVVSSTAGAVRFLASATYAVPLVQPLTIYVAFYARSAVETDATIFDGIGASARCVLKRSSTVFNALEIYAGTSLFSASGSFPWSGSARTIAACVFNGASSALYVNSATTPLASGNAGTQGIDGLTAFGRYVAAGSSSYFFGDIEELAGYSAAHTLSERTAVMGAISARTSIALS